MKREEVARRMRESIIDQDKELTYSTYNVLVQSLYRFKDEIGLKGNYEELSLRHQGGEVIFQFKENSLALWFDQEENKIYIKKRTSENEKILDKITADNGKLICNDGEFKIEEIDEYLSRCFAKLLK
ncbi:hypothetical protein [Rossellomorea sp. DA94]|uniref:hypothetical protein n=1 Tax=Rossellomorea sp. DA94 TaxID=3038653 RepID=UPI0024485C38|nr:hypothetical protein [Rossellomorea sp. DA94]WGG44166.1 hypothetical protein P8596_15420 [Rossellomorea sp. DA94]